jgi:hypothetical protein
MQRSQLLTEIYIVSKYIICRSIYFTGLDVQFLHTKTTTYYTISNDFAINFVDNTQYQTIFETNICIL